ncbi:hypothetical protein ACII1X_004580, partial [Salmonella enterica]
SHVLVINHGSGILGLSLFFWGAPQKKLLFRIVSSFLPAWLITLRTDRWRRAKILVDPATSL